MDFCAVQDLSDIQWRVFRESLPHATGGMLLFVLLKKAVRCLHDMTVAFYSCFIYHAYAQWCTMHLMQLQRLIVCRVGCLGLPAVCTSTWLLGFALQVRNTLYVIQV